jgi:hypothetical protein
LTTDHRCSIHPVSPYGCAFFDSHMSKEQADRRSIAGLSRIVGGWRTDDNYAQIWAMLYQTGRIAPGPEDARGRMKRAMAICAGTGYPERYASKCVKRMRSAAE